MAEDSLDESGDALFLVTLSDDHLSDTVFLILDVPIICLNKDRFTTYNPN